MPPIIAFIMILFSWRSSFFIVGAITLVWAIIWAWYFRDDPHQHPAMTEDELAALLPAPTSTSPQNIPLGRLAVRMIPVALVYFTYGWALWLFLGWMPQYFKYSFKLNITHSALFASSIFLAGVIGDVVGGILTDRLLLWTGSLQIARRNMVVFGMLGALVSLAPMIYVHDLKSLRRFPCDRPVLL